MILSFDPSSKTGYCVMADDGVLIEYGIIKTNAKLNRAKRTRQFERFIEDLVNSVKPDTVVLENVVKGNYKSAAARYWIINSYSIIERVLDDYDENTLDGITSLTPTPGQWKKQILGNGRAKKTDSVHYVNELYGLDLPISKHDIAEAICMAEYGLERKVA